MTGPSQPVLATRRAVRAALADLNRDELVVVACSGGADSLALAAALAHVAPRQGLRAGAVTVDHGLQAGSADRAERVAAVLGGLGLDPVEAVRVEVAGGAGPEDAARRARYAALETMADRLGAAAVVLGHTRDDQAETVLLRLARGSGTRSLAGMPAVSGRYRRPFLGLPRSVVRAAASAAGLEVWDDPHNADPAYLRPRVRHQALPAVEAALGPGVVAALARSADLVRADADALDSWADEVGAGVLGAGGVVDAQALSRWPQAVRTRVLRRFVVDGGCPAGELNAGHLLAVDALVSRWRGQGEVALPGGVWVRRDCGRLLLRRALGTASRQETRER